ncbi:hypothetical protein [Pseudoflavonifractor phocaeensis]|uniref:hypothetical protein n=1 Tax=Pseudoflavonifractor phocaeensis TaxID=1870988 RepID=UPI001F25E9E6|nr:hypothetical protein [Pseudoflavonifractor phocaeensis]MCF2662700.1 hypothetical protein [Pseudoflavonifractor phocaeensis]
MKPTFEEALAVCVQYYVDRGNPVELAKTIVSRGETAVFDLYYAIQEEKKLPQSVATVVSLTQPDSGNSAEIFAADG